MSGVITAKTGIIAGDYALEDDCTYSVKNGDFVVSASDKVVRRSDRRSAVINACDQQHIIDILASNKGNWRFHPLTGADMVLHLNGLASLQQKIRLEKSIRTQLERDVFRVDALNVDRLDDIHIEAQRIKE